MKIFSMPDENIEWRNRYNRQKCKLLIFAKRTASAVDCGSAGARRPAEDAKSLIFYLALAGAFERPAEERLVCIVCFIYIGFIQILHSCSCLFSYKLTQTHTHMHVCVCVFILCLCSRNHFGIYSKYFHYNCFVPIH